MKYYKNKKNDNVIYIDDNNKILGVYKNPIALQELSRKVWGEEISENAAFFFLQQDPLWREVFATYGLTYPTGTGRPDPIKFTCYVIRQKSTGKFVGRVSEKLATVMASYKRLIGNRWYVQRNPPSWPINLDTLNGYDIIKLEGSYFPDTDAVPVDKQAIAEGRLS